MLPYHCAFTPSSRLVMDACVESGYAPVLLYPSEARSWPFAAPPFFFVIVPLLFPPTPHLVSTQRTIRDRQVTVKRRGNKICTCSEPNLSTATPGTGLSTRPLFLFLSFFFFFLPFLSKRYNPQDTLLPSRADFLLKPEFLPQDDGMERPPVFSLDVLADRSLVKDVVKGIACSCNAVVYFMWFLSKFQTNFVSFG